MALGGWKTERMMRRFAAVTDRTLRAAGYGENATSEENRRALLSREYDPLGPAPKPGY